jgi:electron-transferring-flavoprotein dehydrogenase
MATYLHHLSLSTAEERETLDCDVLFVGGGPACLAGAYHLAKRIEAHNESGEGEKLEPMIVLIDKAQEIGAHGLSGAVMNPVALKELIPDYKEKGAPIESDVASDDFYFLTRTGQFKVPYVPGYMSNHGYEIVSVAKLTRWLAQQVEAAGVNVFPGFAGVEVIEEGSRVAGVRTGDKGINAQGEKKGNFEAGIDLKSRVTVFGDGPRGYLSKELIRKRNLLEGKSRQVFETGVKEVFEMPEGRTEAGRVIHTLGYPFPRDAVGGTWMYQMNNLVSIGLVMPLDAKDPLIDQHTLFTDFKNHPFVKKILEGGKPVQYGAKVISSGGYYSMPKLCTDGAMLVGECASMVDMQKLKGIHLAIKSGMLAAERIFETLKTGGDFTAEALAPYETNIYDSYVGESLHRTRHFHRALSLGLPKALFHLGIQHFFGGRDSLTYDVEPDRKATESMQKYHGQAMDAPAPPKTDGSYTLDKVSDVYLSGTMHEEDQPSHLKILDRQVCFDSCVDTYRYPCNRFCPAKVYEMVREEDSGALRLQVNFANCVHCQTCDIKCPLGNIRWTPPEGGQGPNYTLL